jgi:hypothetical protein
LGTNGTFGGGSNVMPSQSAGEIVRVLFGIDACATSYLSGQTGAHHLGGETTYWSGSDHYRLEEQRPLWFFATRALCRSQSLLYVLPSHPQTVVTICLFFEQTAGACAQCP